MNNQGIGFRIGMVSMAIVLAVTVPIVAYAGGDAEDPVATEGQAAPVTFTVSTPPDPNIIPLAVLRDKADEWGIDVNVEIVTAPAGDS